MKRILFIAILGLLAPLPNASAQQHTQAAKKYIKQGIERFSKGDIAGAIVEYDRAITIEPAGATSERGKASDRRRSVGCCRQEPRVNWLPNGRINRGIAGLSRTAATSDLTGSILMVRSQTLTAQLS